MPLEETGSEELLGSITKILPADHLKKDSFKKEYYAAHGNPTAEYHCYGQTSGFAPTRGNSFRRYTNLRGGFMLAKDAIIRNREDIGKGLF